MATPPLHVVTGAFGYSGKYITRRLLERGVRVATLTNSPDRPNEFGDRVRAMPLQFADRDALATSLAGVSVLYNTYWVRFNHSLFNHETAVANTLVLFEAARRADVGRIIHVSITNPNATSPLPYFSGKAQIEQGLAESGVPPQRPAPRHPVWSGGHPHQQHRMGTAHFPDLRDLRRRPLPPSPNPCG